MQNIRYNRIFCNTPILRPTRQEALRGQADTVFHSGHLWAVREAKYLAIITYALNRLRDVPDLPESEVELNRHFYFCLLEASRELYPEDEIAPVAECNNQPDPDDEARAKRELKRPDLQWVYLDRYEASARHSSKQFVVECKRLGQAVRSDWVLNVNYVQHGIMRFKLPLGGHLKTGHGWPLENRPTMATQNILLIHCRRPLCQDFSRVAAMRGLY